MKGFLQSCLVLMVTSCFANTPPQSAIASSNPLATKAGFEILHQGGNAFDTAIAMTAVLTSFDYSLSHGSFLLQKTNTGVIALNGKIIGEAPALAYLAKGYSLLPLSTILGPALKIAKDPQLITSFKNIQNIKESPQVTVNQPLSGQYEDLTLYASPLQGGIELILALKILSEFETDDLSEADRKHLVVESMRQAECAVLLAKEPMNALLSEESVEKLHDNIKINKKTMVKNCDNAVADPKRASFVVMDQQGNRVSALLGTSEAKFNTPVLFTMEEGEGALATTGDHDIAVLLLTLLTAEDDYFPHTWMLTPRYSATKENIEFEKNAFPTSLQNALGLRGHTLKAVNDFGDAQGIFWETKNNKIYSASDPRGKGLAMVEKIGSQNYSN